MILLPSAAIFTVTGSSPIAWGFLGIRISQCSTFLLVGIADFVKVRMAH
jgi:hypothetical protein